MRGLVRAAILVVAASGAASASLSAQSPTGPGKASKSGVIVTDGVGALPGDETALLSLGEEEVVSLLLYQPIKLLGSGTVPAHRRPALKDLVARAELEVRSVIASLSAGDLTPPVAAEALADVRFEFAEALQELSVAR